MPPAPQAPLDATAHNWVEYAPPAAQPYLRLMRLDRPIGAWLLFLPCVFGVALGSATQPHGFGNTANIFLAGLFGLGAIVMRGAGCTYNDIVDRDIDAQVARTRGRPIPSGAVGLKAAWLFLGAQCGLGLLVLLQLNPLSVVLGAASLVLVALYPFMKRVTWWPQAWLGLTFNWGALLGFAAATGRLALPAFLLYAGCFFWTLGYDTIYAHQDKEDDALIGVKSTARLFGDNSHIYVAAFYFAAILLVALGLAAAGARIWTLLFLAPAALHLLWQAARLDVNDTQNCLALFRSNRDTGLLIAAALIATSYVH